MRTQISDIKLKEVLIDLINTNSPFANTKSTFYEHIRTIYKIEKERCLRLYDEYYFDIQSKKNDKKEEIAAKTLEENITDQVLNKIQCLEILSNIAKGTPRDEGDQIIIPSSSEQIAAIKQIGLFLGYNAAIKTDVTTNGKEIDSPLDKLIKSGGKITING